MTIKNLISIILDESNTARDSINSKRLSELEQLMRKHGLSTIENSNTLFEMNSISSIELGLLSLPFNSKLQIKKVYNIILIYADSENWEIREYAGSSLCEFLRFHFREYKKKLIDLRQSSSENLRRCVVLGLKYLGKYRTLGISSEILEILEYYFDDPSDYVKRNLGQFAIGDSLIIYDTEGTKRLLNKLHLSDNPIVRWNVAMVFSAAASCRVADWGVFTLLRYLNDIDKQVRNAAIKGLKNIYIRKPEFQTQIRLGITGHSQIQIFSESQLKFIKNDI